MHLISSIIAPNLIIPQPLDFRVMEELPVLQVSNQEENAREDGGEESLVRDSNDVDHNVSTKENIEAGNETAIPTSDKTFTLGKQSTISFVASQFFTNVCK